MFFLFLKQHWPLIFMLSSIFLGMKRKCWFFFFLIAVLGLMVLG